MKRSRFEPCVLALLLAAAAVSCGAAAGQPGRAGGAIAVAAAQASREADAADTVVATRPYTEADVRFMQGMIVHHAQALVMTGLVPERAQRREIEVLARRIRLSQEDEIALMRRWLEARGEPVPDLDDPAGAGHHHGGAVGTAPLAHGMLSESELRGLARATGAEFDRLFLELMIRHHEGALVMVEELLATDGAAQDPEVYRFAAHVEADQRMEIARMRRLLDATPQRGR